MNDFVYNKLCKAEELNNLLKEQQLLLKKIRSVEADIAALNAIEEADELLRRLS